MLGSKRFVFASLDPSFEGLYQGFTFTGELYVHTESLGVFSMRQDLGNCQVVKQTQKSQGVQFKAGWSVALAAADVRGVNLSFRLLKVDILLFGRAEANGGQSSMCASCSDGLYLAHLRRIATMFLVEPS